ncbi:hypothetical protein [Halalkalibacter akibai]|uniref:Uncharacterized protein n=1 Tax=Halalkalibacter akibai (strain ATCC 43226 / DSM 21942 / CIP 109018 / JCM 9157 / 1139) TaxID=1236973 RepID=W4QR08_HALA3|nr:hypothetical protein [Halalkalibacter akibai]GAE34362.1 hypothetical protein JCM9157_1413 [Halalkalibacter akibai JCM 9157]
MDVEMSAEQVMMTIQQLNAAGENLSKKKIKKTHPQLMRSALHFFPDWDNAIERSKL